jgi:hypothetical protein
MEKYVVTIARQFGSLGRPIAKRLSEILGIEYYDRAIVDAAVKKTGLGIETVSNFEESAKQPWFHMKFPLGNFTTETQDQIFMVQEQMISNLAEKENCIVVGRCADYILRNHPNCINIYICASYEQRMINCVESLFMEPQAAKKMIYEVDKARDAYHFRYAHYLPQDHKDIIINSGFLGVDGTAEVLACIVKKKLQEMRKKDLAK